jgi:hypothetical protein
MNFLYFCILFLKLFLFCLCNLFINRLTITLFRDRISQVLVGINSNSIAVLVQYRGRLLISVVASKIENMFLITLPPTRLLIPLACKYTIPELYVQPSS